ncbi:hypothetical protein KIN20_002740 [Parelaphostrongylus tenuis]|uniref:Major facilitator superfamily (MFS) profile domain-containing protein n=1 Tax=Parelaphostrongylus tenuis TaxID=148309 RepID=A0AAD5MEM1_PARTN|nr:hypothetical protein KIN20_002740 [Parelaphostrongylus tenuis]
MPVAGVFCESLGWRPLYYLFGTIGLLSTAAFFYLYKDDPRKHRMVSAKELKAITAGKEGQQERGPVPYMKICKDPCIQAVARQHVHFVLVCVTIGGCVTSFVAPPIVAVVCPNNTVDEALFRSNHYWTFKVCPEGIKGFRTYVQMSASRFSLPTQSRHCYAIQPMCAYKRPSVLNQSDSQAALDAEPSPSTRDVAEEFGVSQQTTVNKLHQFDFVHTKPHQDPQSCRTMTGDFAFDVYPLDHEDGMLWRCELRRSTRRMVDSLSRCSIFVAISTVPFKLLVKSEPAPWTKSASPSTSNTIQNVTSERIVVQSRATVVPSDSSRSEHNHRANVHRISVEQ